jgi:hypothetical protein
LNQAWLADEKGLAHGCIVISNETKHLMAQCRLFSEAYDKYLKPVTVRGVLESVIEAQAPKLAKVGITLEIGGRSYGAFSADEFAAILAKNLKSKMESMPPEMRIQFRNHILQAAGSFDFGEKSGLTASSPKSKNSDVKSELEKLMARVKRQSERPGAKSALAKFLDVAPARITEWLHIDPEMRKEPGGNYTLQLLKWVEQQEHQK